MEFDLAVTVENFRQASPGPRSPITNPPIADSSCIVHAFLRVAPFASSFASSDNTSSIRLSSPVLLPRRVASHRVESSRSSRVESSRFDIRTAAHFVTLYSSPFLPCSSSALVRSRAVLPRIAGRRCLADPIVNTAENSGKKFEHLSPSDSNHFCCPPSRGSFLCSDVLRTYCPSQHSRHSIDRFPMDNRFGFLSRCSRVIWYCCTSGVFGYC